MCMLQRTRGKVGRPRATEETASGICNQAHHQCVPRLALAEEPSTQAGSGPSAGGSAWGCKRWGQAGRWTTVGTEPSPRASCGPALAPKLSLDLSLRTVAHPPRPLASLPICIPSSPRLKRRVDLGLIWGVGMGGDP